MATEPAADAPDVTAIHTQLSEMWGELAVNREGVNTLDHSVARLSDEVRHLDRRYEELQQTMESCWHMLDMICTHLGLPTTDTDTTTDA